MQGIFKSKSEDELLYIRLLAQPWRTVEELKKEKEKENFSIFDARPHLNATVNRLKGCGTEDSDVYKNIKLIYLNIGNIHEVLSAYKNVSKICKNH